MHTYVFARWLRTGTQLQVLSYSHPHSLSFSLFPPLFLSTFTLSVAVLRGSEYLVHYIDHVTRSAIKSQTMCTIR